MKTQNRLIKITVIIGIVLCVLVERVMSSENREAVEIFETDDMLFKYILPSTILSEEDELKLEDYTKENMHYTFVKNILADDNDKINTPNTTDIIVTESDIDSTRKNYNCLYTCFYTEVEENGRKKKKYVPYEEATGKEKKILIIPKDIDNKLLKQIKKAKNRLINPEEDTKIKSAIEIIKRVINQNVCRLYIDNATIKYSKDELEQMRMKNTTAYALLSREKEFSEQKDHKELFNSFKSKVKDIKKLLRRNMPLNPINENNRKEIQKVFVKDTKIIATQIMDRKQNYNGKTVEELKNELSEDLNMFIDTLINGRIEFHTCINRKELKKEIKKEEGKEVKKRLIKAVNKCINHQDINISIGELQKKIKNKENPSYDKEKERKKTELSASQEKEEIRNKADEMLTRIINSGNIEISINTDKPIYKDMPWNRDLVRLLRKIRMKYNEFEGTEEKLIEHITAVNTQIAREVVKNRRKKYDTHKNISVIRKLIKNELLQINSILEKKKDSNGLRSKTTAEETEEIISILENISNKTTVVTEEEKVIQRALEYISLGKEVPEEEIRDIREALKCMSQERDSPERQNKLRELLRKMSLDDNALEEEIRDIRSVLSEIEEEFIKPEDYKVTDKTIYRKKQEIVNMVMTKLSIITEDRETLKIKMILRGVIEDIVGILVNRTVDHTQYKGLKSVKEEIEREEECIRSLNLANMFNTVFEFVEKYSFLIHNSMFYHYESKNYFINSECITQLKDAIRNRRQNEVADLLLHGIFNKQSHNFFVLVMISYQIDKYIDTLKSYNEIWLNPAYFHCSSKLNNTSRKCTSAYIRHRHMLNGKLHRRKVNPTDENLKAFRNARTAQGIEKIKKYRWYS